MSEKSFKITFKPSGITVDAQGGETVHEAAARGGVQIARPCGGSGICGKCRVKARRCVGPPAETEKKVLGEEVLNEGIRLACMARISGDGEILVLDEVDGKSSKILSKISEEELFWEPDSKGYGAAFDIGTTTVVAYLLDLERYHLIDSISFLNPQITYGDDVISRISFASSEDGLRRLQKVLVEGMNQRLEEMASRNGLGVQDIYQVAIVGNTVMEHLLAGVSPESIGVSPYKPNFLSLPPQAAAPFGMKIHPEGQIKFLPNVAGYVGADIVSGVSVTGIADSAAVRLFVDTGTNNEIVLGSSEAIYCCATAAGPAFEGARIGSGMRAAAGAIEKVYRDEDRLVVETIEDAPARGICGSGLVDAVAVLLEDGIVDRKGRMVYPEECDDPWIRERMDRGPDGILRILLAEGEKPVYITQKDVREVQLALGAVKVGIEVLLERADLALDDVDEVLLAGAFGNYIDQESAVRVGLLPPVPLSKIRGVRNAAGRGAVAALASAPFWETTHSVARKMRYIELSTLRDFQKRFMKAMLF
ncbi:MAG: ASKHA domain-containing protein [Thermovirgaceae bacterium]